MSYTTSSTRISQRIRVTAIEFGAAARISNTNGKPDSIEQPCKWLGCALGKLVNVAAKFSRSPEERVDRGELSTSGCFD